MSVQSLTLPKGLEYAVKNKFDIVSMSFGFDYQKLNNNKRGLVEKQLEELEKSALVFAAASNKGLSNDDEVAWPASRQEIFGVYSASGDKGRSSEFNPQINRANSRAMFKFVGENIVSTCRDQNEGVSSGTSVATVVAAATAAMIVEYIQSQAQEGAGYIEDAESPERGRQRKRLAELVNDMRKPRHIHWIFQNISVAHDSDFLRYLHPSSLLAVDSKDKSTLDASNRAMDKLLKCWDKSGRPH